MSAFRTLTLLTILLVACSTTSTPPEVNMFQHHYTKHNVNGSFVLYDLGTDEYIKYNEGQFETPYTPASTFKICNSLIGLETGVIRDENHIIKWDSIERRNPNWNKDTDLKEAFKNSTVWYYQELAKRVGPDTMKLWLDRLAYGNSDISGGIAEFWLTGGLRISPKQQIDFLKRFYNESLPISQRTLETVKAIMMIEKTADHTIYGKTGWGFQDNIDIGWFVGFIEVNDNSYLFANCIQTDDPNNQNFGSARTDIVYGILQDLQLIE